MISRDIYEIMLPKASIADSSAFLIRFITSFFVSSLNVSP